MNSSANDQSTGGCGAVPASAILADDERDIARSTLVWRVTSGDESTFECRVHARQDGPLLAISRNDEVILVGQHASISAAHERAAGLRRLFAGWDWMWLELTAESWGHAAADR